MRILALMPLLVLAFLAQTTECAASIHLQLADRALSVAPISSPLDSLASVPVASDAFFLGQEWLADLCPATWGPGCLPLSVAVQLPALHPDLLTGSDTRSRPGPSPMALWALVGLCCGAGGFLRERKQSRKAVRRTRQRNSRSVARAPWPEHVRAAILEIVTRGNAR